MIPSFANGSGPGLEAGERRIERRVEIPRDALTVWAHWARFAEFPDVLRAVVRVHSIGEHRSLWETYIGGFQQLWEAEIVERDPPRRLAWRSIRGFPHRGEVVITPTSAHSSRVSLRIHYWPRSLLERVGARLGIVDRTVARELDRLVGWITRRAPAETSSEPACGSRAAPRPGREGDGTPGHRRRLAHALDA